MQGSGFNSSPRAGVGDVNAGEYFDDKSGKMKRVYRELSPRATTVMGQWVAEALGVAGVRLARLEVQDEERSQVRARETVSGPGGAGVNAASPITATGQPSYGAAEALERLRERRTAPRPAERTSTRLAWPP